ncbi:hypothetical protein FRB90_006800, partial [Tulasnella sp. 427]
PKQDPNARLREVLLVGNRVALELHIKQWSKAGDKASHALFGQSAVQLLRRGDDGDVQDIHAALNHPKANFSGADFFNEA